MKNKNMVELSKIIIRIRDHQSQEEMWRMREDTKS